MNFSTRQLKLVILAPVAIVAIAACGGTASEPTPEGTQPAPLVPPATEIATPVGQGVEPTPTQSTDPTATQTETPPAVPIPPVSELQMPLASSDLSVGPNRFVFGLIDSQSGPVRDAQVQVSTFYRGGGGAEGPIESVPGVFRKWPVGPGGVYTAQLSFDRPGLWGVGALVIGADGSLSSGSVQFEVQEASATPAIGSPAPRSVNKTARDVEKLEEITTDLDPDPEIYAMTIVEAIDTGKPIVVSFSTPAFCETATCGPQLDVVKDLKERYRDRVNFIHVEIFDNPEEMQGDRSKGRLAPAVVEWNLPSEPWTFIVDSDGLVSAKFEAFTTSEELEEALVGVLQEEF